MILQARRLRDINVELAVAGAHLRDEPLNHELVDRGARFGRLTATSPCYRLFALPTYLFLATFAIVLANAASLLTLRTWRPFGWHGFEWWPYGPRPGTGVDPP